MTLSIKILAEQIRVAIELEREECAKVCEDATSYQEDDPGDSFAELIRARSKNNVKSLSKNP